MLISTLTALGFGFGAVFTLLGLIFIYQLFILNKQFRSQALITVLSVTTAVVGFTLLWASWLRLVFV